MSTHYNGFIVILDRDIRDDDAEHTLNAIRMIKGVLRVQPHIADANYEIARMRERAKIESDLLEIINK